jgi:hypothetical protein
MTLRGGTMPPVNVISLQHKSVTYRRMPHHGGNQA